MPQEERVDMSWVTLDRICQEKADAEEDFRRELELNGRPLRSSAAPLSDDELLAKLRELGLDVDREDRKSTRLNSSHGYISYAVFCLKKKKNNYEIDGRPLHRRRVTSDYRHVLIKPTSL